MPIPTATPASASGALPAEADAALLAVPVLGDEASDALSDLPTLDAAAGGAIGEARSSGAFRGKRRETFETALRGNGWRASRVVLIGAPMRPEGPAACLREAAAVAARVARAQRAPRFAFVCRGDADRAELGQAVGEGIVTGGFSDTRYKSSADENGSPAQCEVVWPDGDGGSDAAAAVARGATIGAATNLARELANQPSNLLRPAMFAERAAAVVAEAGVAVEVLDETGIARLGMGLLLGVGQGSDAPPRLLVMRHEPPGAPAEPVLGLVGKGVTFDSGGISIKPAAGMEWMKSDMAGGAAVVGAMRAIGALGAPRRVIGIVPMAENMPGGRATRPGDILTGADGTTVEVLNTDAEGRLILGDALWYARKCGATHLVDVATLTGACVIALGGAASGLFARPADWSGTLQAAAARAGERAWPMPLYEDYREQLRSELADLKNIGGREAGACTAAAFLDAFSGGLPWAHLDIAGTAWIEKPREDAAAGATGVMVRTLTELAVGDRNW
jgi:leucyl aminopeptidase